MVLYPLVRFESQRQNEQAGEAVLSTEEHFSAPPAATTWEIDSL